jgi:hypothetical protein
MLMFSDFAIDFRSSAEKSEQLRATSAYLDEKIRKIAKEKENAASRGRDAGAREEGASSSVIEDRNRPDHEAVHDGGHAVEQEKYEYYAGIRILDQPANLDVKHDLHGRPSR